MTEKTLPTLYKLSSTGNLQQWTISTLQNTIITRWGVVDGKIQETRDAVEEGKNIGRSNETTPVEQAESEALSAWEKKLKKDYVKTKAAASRGDASSLIAGGILPMLAQRYDKYADKITFPAYVQPKLDGHRCIAVIKDNKVTLWSRTRKPITSMPHIVAELESFELGTCILDGELYNHDYKDRFEELSSLIRPQTPKPGHDVVHYHMYDFVSDSKFSKRMGELEASHYQHFIYQGYDGALRVVPTELCLDPDSLMCLFKKHRADGYEGSIVRNADGLYVNKRSYDLQKVKAMDDAEFEIVGVIEGRGKLKGHGIFVCVTKEGTQFEAKMSGNLENLKDYLQNPDAYIGRMLTVQFQGLTGKSNVPRFPVGLRFFEAL